MNKYPFYHKVMMIRRAEKQHFFKEKGKLNDRFSIVEAHSLKRRKEAWSYLFFSVNALLLSQPAKAC